MLGMLFDSALFTIPPYANDEVSVHSMLERLVHWANVASEGLPITFLKLSNTETVLQDSNCAPELRDIEELLVSTGLSDVYTPWDIQRSYFDLIGRSNNLADFSVEALECKDCFLQPDPLCGQSPLLLVEHSKLVYVSQILNQPEASNVVLCTASGAPHVGKLEIDVSATVVKATGKLLQNLNIPENIRSSLFLFDRLTEVFQSLNAFDLWEASQSLADCYLSLLIGCAQIGFSNRGTLTWQDIPKFAVGSDFLASMDRLHVGPRRKFSGVIFKSCCHAILRNPKNPIKVMGKPKQLKRESDSALAWRTHITKHHEALRLMIWESGDTYEIANVGNKQELEISRSSPSGRYYVF
jgi:hypothetical protein